jgi:hypothetical protein
LNEYKEKVSIKRVKGLQMKIRNEAAMMDEAIVLLRMSYMRERMVSM